MDTLSNVNQRQVVLFNLISIIEMFQNIDQMRLERREGIPTKSWIKSCRPCCFLRLRQDPCVPQRPLLYCPRGWLLRAVSEH